jgi:predicted DNA-binding transcriptional regulator YafY
MVRFIEDSYGPQSPLVSCVMAQADRLLDLLALLAARAHWAAAELAERLEITERTVRRDIARLREIGYPVDAVPGLHGGYALGAGGRLPPLLLDDDEATAVAIGLTAAVGTGSSGFEDAAVSALSKLDRVLPPQLRERVAALRQVTLGLQRPGLPSVDTETLVVLALACQRPERVRFDYRDAAGTVSHRLVEPYRLVFTDRQWYLVCFDTTRDDWRTFRLDRISEPRSTGQPFARGAVPDAVEIVAEGVAVGGYGDVTTVRLAVERSMAERLIPATVGVITAADDATTTVQIGGDADWVARYLAGCALAFEPVDAPELRKELRLIGERLVAAYA